MRWRWLMASILLAVLLVGCQASPNRRTGTTPESTEAAAGPAGPAGPLRSPAPTASPVPEARPSAVVGAEPTSTSVPVTASPSLSVEIRVVNFGFEPAEITVAPGTTIVWRNDSPTTHTVTAKNGAFDSGLLEGGKDYSVTLTQPGTYEYWCTLHPEMVGRVIVR